MEGALASMPEPTIFVVDDDQAVRESLRWLIEAIGLAVETFGSPSEFLGAYDRDRPGCVVLDVRLPGMSGLELQEKLRARGIDIPVIMITAFGDVPTAVRAMKGGAADFIEKPFNDQELLDCIQRCVERNGTRRQEQSQRATILARLARLTTREREVLDLVVAGNTSTAIAEQLGIGRRTVDSHRARMMRKMEAKTVQALLRMVDITHSR